MARRPTGKTSDSGGGTPTPPPQPANYNIQIILALITLVGGMFTATVTNWDKLFGRPAVAAPVKPPVEPPVNPGPKAGPRTGDDPAIDPVTPPHVASTGGDDADDQPGSAVTTATVAGLWGDSDGYGYRIQQNGNAIRFAVGLNGQVVGGGEGTITGRKLSYQYVNANDNGHCQADLATDGQSISGRCTSQDGNSWPFLVAR